MKISAQLVKKLREKTGSGMMNCKQALEKTNGNFEKAITFLRQKGLASADKKASRNATEGIIESYIHTGQKLGVLIEINCETDFVARHKQFQELAKDIAMQIAASESVQYISYADIPEELITQEKIIEAEKDDLKDKPDEIKEKIVAGRVEKTFKTLCLLDQIYIKEQTVTVEQLIKFWIAKLGENIKVSRFVRFNLGEVN
uniref:elongation factor Ts n=1 Tax=Haramonas pauciplastida TaxID=478668 RepID=UPI002113A742|nr:elongation factor Ts [Haramonas pauciplastida]UTE95002.1 elongation factor Ts [Haramonas pauciplastida]